MTDVSRSIVQLDGGRGRPRPPVSRSADRRVTAAAVVTAAGFVLAAGLALLLPADVRHGGWLPLHLLLAGAAATAIAGVMPFFSAAVAAAPPAPFGLRVTGVTGVAIGAAGVTLSRTGGDLSPLLAAASGAVYLVGLGAVGAATLLPLRSALGPRRVVMGVSYGAAVVAVMLGATLGTLFLVGWSPVLIAWDVAKPAHVWLNAFGFVSFVIGASLVHLLPTVAGARIARTTASTVALLGLGVGPLVTALGFVLRSDALARAGSAVFVAGTLALGVHALDVLRRRGRWTTDAPWHGFALASLVAAVAWFILAAGAAAAMVLEHGASARAWDASTVVVPLALGWVLQALLGAWTHLVPAVGPGSPLEHARQRAILGRAWRPRLVGFEVGVAIAALSLPASVGEGVLVGLALVGVVSGAGVLLLVLAVLVGARAAPTGR